MEVQVNIVPGDGELVTGEYNGKQWRGYTDGLTTWKPFRIPWNAKFNPQYTDSEMKFDLSKHAEAIGMTGWDWKNKVSRWVAFDFDSITNHKKGLTKNELNEIKERTFRLPYVSCFNSTSALGFHVYIFFHPVIPCVNHTDHSSIARSVLNKVSSDTGIDLKAAVDCYGGNMWVWHIKAHPKGFDEIKVGVPLSKIPTWIPSSPREEKKLLDAKYHVGLDSEHRRLLKWFEDHGGLWWMQDGMLVCHTSDLRKAHTALKLLGFFDTIATGKNTQDQNCFAFPEEDGAWIVRRHGKGTSEHELWFDNDGWTTIFYNKEPSLRSAALNAEGTQDERNYHFDTIEEAVDTLISLGVQAVTPDSLSGRKAILKETDQRVCLSVMYIEGDNEKGWAKSGNKFQKFFRCNRSSTELLLPDALVRYLTVQGTEVGWMIYTNNSWIQNGKANIPNVLGTLGYNAAETKSLIGKMVLNNWSMVSKPFTEEYPGNREWNKNAAQFRYQPERGKHPTWNLILNHLGEKIDENYLQTWIGSLFQYPSDPLPYLTFTGEQNTGKSIFHESLCCLFTKGYIRADNSLTNPSGFNGELANSILCIVEETNLSKSGPASDRIKDWVTGRTIAIRALYQQTYEVKNCTHWVQCTNDSRHCPVFPGDTRITMIPVGAIKSEIPKGELLLRCEQEAPAFLYSMLNLSIPPTKGRLRIPVLETVEKEQQQEYNESDLQSFVREYLEEDISDVLLSTAFEKFSTYIGAQSMHWSLRRFSKELKFIGIKVERKGKGGLTHILNRHLIGNSL